MLYREPEGTLFSGKTATLMNRRRKKIVFEQQGMLPKPASPMTEETITGRAFKEEKVRIYEK